MKQFLFTFALLLSTIRVSAQFINIPDPAFKASVLNSSWGYDINNDQEIDSAEALLIDTLFCVMQNISSVTGIESFPNLLIFRCGENNITSMDLSQNLLIREVSAYQNSLTYLNVTGCSQLILLRLFWNYLPKLDVSTCSNLEYLDVVGNSIDSLDLTNNPVIYSLDCFSNSMEYLNIANGNNSYIGHFYGDWNLYDCITVDDPAYSYANWVGIEFIFDSTTIFSTNCNPLSAEVLSGSIQVEMAPNPTNDRIEIHVNESLNYSLLSIKGELIENGNLFAGTNHLFLSNLQAGIYFLHVENEQRIGAVKRIEKL